MALPVSFYSETINDNTLKGNGQPESANWAVPVTTLTAGNYAAQSALIAALQTAVDGIVIGTTAKIETVILRSVFTPGAATTPLAQRENKWLCRYHGSTLGKKFRVAIPTADLTLLAANSEFLVLTGGAGAALKSAFEAVVKSPDDGAETVVLDSVQFVGRNS